MNYISRPIGIALSCVFCSFLVACENTDQLPNNAQVSVSPNEKNITMSANPDLQTVCIVSEDTLYQDIPILISVTNDQGVPLGDIDVGVYADYTGNTFSGPEVLQVFADHNGNGVVDGLTELVSGSESGVYTTSTDKYHGTATVFVRMNLTCPYRGQLVVFAGPNSATVDFEVQYESGNSPGGDTGGGSTAGDEEEGVGFVILGAGGRGV